MKNFMEEDLEKLLTEYGRPIEIEEVPEASFSDLNNTIVDTRPFLTFEDISFEGIRLAHLKKLLKALGEVYRRKYDRDFIFIIVTGNSFDNARGRIEPYQLWEIPGIELIISAENGAFTQSFKRGFMWKLNPTEKYRENVRELVNYARKEHKGKFWLQGNVVRETFKPIDRRYFDEKFVPDIIEYGKQLGFELYEGKQLSPDRSGTFYWHKGDALDVDPSKGEIDGKLVEFEGKSYPVRRLSEELGIEHALCIGDSLSDVPMFEASNELGYECFLVGNHSFEKVPPYIRVVERFQVGTINVLLANVLRLLYNL